MSSDSERLVQPSKRRRLVISDDESSEGSIVGRTHRKRRVYRVVSDGESTDDDNDVPKPVTRRKNYRVVSDDGASYGSDSEVGGSSQSTDGSTSSEWQSDWESASDDSEAESIEHKRRSKSSKSSKSPKKEKNVEVDETAATNAGVESDASDGQSDKCPICLLPFRDQEVATPSCCDHCFCLLCLMEWSKNINTCPVDRQVFTALHARTNVAGKVTRQVPIETKTNVEETIQEDPTYCEVCHQCDREDRMLLCDGCDLGYHLECLNPPINEVPMDEWYCPECSRNSQDDAEVVDIDLDEISDLMAEARGLGVSYGRTRTGIPHENANPYGGHRLIPRTRQTERVRANIRADRNRTRAERETRGNNSRQFDPDQPSTSSSGMESISETSRSSIGNSLRNQISASVINAIAAGVGAVASSSSRKRAKTTRKIKKKRKKTTRRSVNADGQSRERMVREVRIREYNDDGEEQEIVTYVNVAPASTKRRKKRTRRRKKRRNRARTVSSMAAATVKKRLANTLGMVKPNGGVSLSGPSVKVRRTPTPRGALNDSRFRARIAQVSLFGNNLGLNYSPPGSDDDIDSAIGDGLLVGTQRRTAVSATRRRFALKGIANPVVSQNDETSSPVVDLIGSIIDSQELWHSRNKTGVTLRADGTLLIEKKNHENKQSINNNESPVKKRDDRTNEDATTPPSGETPLDLSSVNPSDITQAPMYNNPRGGGNRGNFRGGYRDGSRHSQGGQGSYGGRDYNASGGGRHSYGGTGSRDNFGNREFGPPANYNQNFDHRGPPPFGGTPPFRNRNPHQNFRPERQQQRQPMPERPLFQSPMDGHERPQFPHHNNFSGPRIPLGPPPGPPPGLPPGILQNIPNPMSIRPPPPPVVQQEEQSANFHEDFTNNSHVENRESFGPQAPPQANNPTTPERPEDEECDIYCDIEAPNKSDEQQEENTNEGSIALLPPPEPPSGLLDFEEEEEDNSKSEKDNDSDQDLVIDDTPKEERSRGGAQHDDKYDPFAADSDTNDSDREKNDKGKKIRDHKSTPLDPPPMPPEFPNVNVSTASEENLKISSNPLLRLTAYDDDEDEDSQDDCPNFNIYSSETMDVARHTEQELSQQIGPLEPPPMPPDMPDDDDVIVGDVQSCDLADIPEPSDPYVEALRKERQTLSRIPPKKISNDSRGKITFKIGHKFKLNNKLSNLYDELDENIEVSIEQEKEIMEKRNIPVVVESAKKGREDTEKNDEIFPIESIRKSKGKKDSKKCEKENHRDDENVDKLEDAKSSETKSSEIDGEKRDDKTKNSADDKNEDNKEDCENDKEEKDAKITRHEDDNDDDDDDETKESKKESSKVKETCLAMSTIDLTEKSSDTIISIAESIQSSPKKAESSGEQNAGKSPIEKFEKNETRKTRDWRSLVRGRESDDEKLSDDRSDFDENDRKIMKTRKLRKRSIRIEASSDGQSDTEERSSENEGETKDNGKTSYTSSLDQARAGASSSFDVDDETENFPLEKEIVTSINEKKTNDDEERGGWESDGAYTPCKDERPVKEKDNSGHSLSPFESGLEPITPTKDRANDDLDGCRTPVGYAGLGTEAISETDEAMNFEDELTLLTLRKEKEMEDGEIMEDGKSTKKHTEKTTTSPDVEDAKRKRKKDKKEKSKETEKNKENISSENQIAWKKISKSTKDRQYRDKDKRSRSRDRDKEKEKEKEKEKMKPKKKLKETTTKKKEKRKELPRYDVRKIVAEKPARPRKDAYGRDIRDYSRSKSRSRSITRQRSQSRDRRSRSYSRLRSRTRSRSRQRRSWSRDRRSLSKGRRSVSKGRRSLSKGRRSLSKGRRSLSKGRRSLSKGRRSPSKGRRSPSKGRRSPSKGRRSLSKGRGSPSKGRRSISKGRRSPSRRRSLSRIRRKRSITPRRSLSKKRSISRRRGSKSPGRRRRSLSTRRRRRSLSRKHRSRSREKRKEKNSTMKSNTKHKSRSRSRNRKRSRTKSPPAKRAGSKSREKKHTKRKLASRSRSKHRSLSRERDRNRNWNPMSDKPVERERDFSREKDVNRESWSAQWTPSWSRSNSPIVNQHEELAAHTWSPPTALDGVTVPPKNLTVILTNKEAIKKKKKEKRKESKKSRGEPESRRRKNKRTRTPPPSKEVFASGDNILVSVCFNKENETIATGLPELPETIPLLAPTKRRRREPIQVEPAKKQKKDKIKEKRAKSPKGKKDRKKKSKAAEIAATKKPVAVIDLDQSPFREQTPSPRDIIVLSDDDDKVVQELTTPEQHPRPSSPQHDQFVSQGPKTPPEPQVKFSISKQPSNLRPSMMNPLLEEEEEMEEEEEIDERVEEELELRAQEELELRLKIGPNTPPEPPSSPPTSPDAYDPFDPTKSRSPTPTVSQDATPNDERDRNQRNNSPRKHDGDDENLISNETNQVQDVTIVDKPQPEKPKIISMVTIKRASPNRDNSPVNESQTEIVQVLDSPSKVQQNQQNVQTAVNPFATINPVLATVAAAVQRSAIFNTSTPIVGQRIIQQPNRISPSTQIKQRVTDRPQLPNLFANATKPTPIRMQKTLQNKNISTLGQNGSDANLETTNDNILDMSSPYSPGSSLSDGIFDPPSPGNHNGSPANLPSSNKVGTSKVNKSTEKKDAFDVLFGTSPAMKTINKGRTKKNIEKEKRGKKSTNPKVGVRMDENQLQILDDLPSSAVEMQVKDKFLKKLNRQERVVEEVKLVLKPHYTKKHVTKEEYKDIMRKAVPKICHNKTGEINPKKIAQLIEAYVRKCRSTKKKKSSGLPMNSTGKTVKPLKNLWS